MAFPRKFQSLLKIERGYVVVPDYLWLVYAVCAVSQDACGWGGWGGLLNDDYGSQELSSL